MVLGIIFIKDKDVIFIKKDVLNFFKSDLKVYTTFYDDKLVKDFDIFRSLIRRDFLNKKLKSQTFALSFKRHLISFERDGMSLE